MDQEDSGSCISDLEAQLCSREVSINRDGENTDLRVIVVQT